MEHLNNLIKTAEQSWQKNPSTAHPKYADALSSEIESYLERLYLIVDQSFNLSSQTPSDNEKAARSDSWARALMGVVPEGELDRAFDHAFATHKSDFPISAYEVKSAYEDLLNIAARQRETENRDFMKRLEDNRRVTNVFECKQCFNSGFRSVPDPKGRTGPDGQIHTGVVRCTECNSSYFHRQGLND